MSIIAGSPDSESSQEVLFLHSVCYNKLRNNFKKGSNVVHSFIDTVRQAAEQRILFLPHALEEMNAPDELISTAEVRSVIFLGDIIEGYSEDVRGHSCLMLGYGSNQRPVHVVCSPKREYLAVITVYIPTPKRWMADWKTRRAR